MKWHLIPNEPNTGKFNMDFDIKLARNCSKNNCYFRLYQWNPYCISLGANQSLDNVNSDLACARGIDVVNRPTGGRAILHAEEITYSVIIPTDAGISAKKLYHDVSAALMTGLSIYDDNLKALSLEADQPHFPSLLQSDHGELCFGSTARNEIKYKGKKIVGSAQRKMNNALLQHGSILCGPYHRKLVDYIRKDGATVLDLKTTTIEISEITGASTDYQKLADCLIAGFEKSFGIKFDKIIRLVATQKLRISYSEITN